MAAEAMFDNANNFRNLRVIEGIIPTRHIAGPRNSDEQKTKRPQQMTLTRLIINVVLSVKSFAKF